MKSYIGLYLFLGTTVFHGMRNCELSQEI